MAPVPRNGPARQLSNLSITRTNQERVLASGPAPESKARWVGDMEREMNDRSFADMLSELDAELARQNDPYRAARQVITCLEARAPRAILGSAAGIEL